MNLTNLLQSSTLVEISKLSCGFVFVFCFFCVLFLFSSTTRTDTNVCHQSVARNGILYETYLLGHGGSRYCLWSLCDITRFFASCAFYF